MPRPTAPRSSSRNGPWRRLLVPAIATGLALVALVGLGTWQVERLLWKTELLAALGLWAAWGTVSWASVGLAVPLCLVAIGVLGLLASRHRI